MLRIENGNIVSDDILDKRLIYATVLRLKDSITDKDTPSVIYLTSELRREVNSLREIADFIEKELDAITGENK